MAGPNITVFVTADTDQAVAKLRELTTATTAASTQGGKLSGVLSGVGAGLGLAGVMGASAALSTFTGFLGDSVQAAMEAERSEVRLGIALRDNIPHWNGSTAAINAAIDARMRLAFDDEAMADAIGTLVAVTHNEAEAIRLLDLAMNIARFRNIDLAQATDMVAKAATGSTKELNAAVPATRGAASATEALNRAMEATAGQTEAYANTGLGKAEAASNRLENAQERLGGIVMPFVIGAMETAVGVADLLSAGLTSLLGPFGELGRTAGDTAEATERGTNTTRLYTAQVVALLPPTLQATAAQNLLAGELANVATMEDLAAAGAYRLIPAVQQAGNAALDAARKMALYRGEATSNTAALKVNTAGSWSATTAMLALGAGLTGASLGVTKFNNEIRDTPRSVGGATRATQDFTAAVGRAFDALRTKVTRALDAIHERNLRAIEETRRLANEPLIAEMAGIDAAVTEAERKLEDARNKRRQADLEAAVAAATTAEERQAAQQALDDFLADLEIDRMRRDAQARKDTLQAQIDANDQIAKDAIKAEDDRAKADKIKFDAELTRLETHLKNKKITWAKANDELLTMLDKYGLDFEDVGKKMGTKYATGYTKGVNSALRSIAAAVAKLLGLDEATVRGLAAGATSTTAAAATSAAGAPAAAPTAPANVPTSTSPTAGAAPSAAAPAVGTFAVTINAGAFTGTEADAKKFAQQMWGFFLDETGRRQKTWPDAGQYRDVVAKVGV